MNTTLQIRVDKRTKRQAQKTFKDMGIDLSTGVKLFLNQVVRSGGIPFSIRTDNGFTLEQERQIIKETTEALKNSEAYLSISELHKDLLA